MVSIFVGFKGFPVASMRKLEAWFFWKGERHIVLTLTYMHTWFLGLFCVSAEVGDYSHSEHLPGYLSEYSFIPNPPQDFEKEVAKLHQEHK